MLMNCLKVTSYFVSFLKKKKKEKKRKQLLTLYRVVFLLYDHPFCQFVVVA